MAQETEAGALFEAFNAKYLGPEEVAKGFVYSNHFEEVSGPYHAVLVGPRGSGKTTLLKMLQPAALSEWKAPQADAFRERIKYSGVFISSDISWSKQLSALGYGKLSPEHHKILVLACFTTHVLHAVIETMLSRADKKTSYRSVRLDGATEQELAISIANSLKVKPEIATLLSVKQALRNRLSDIRTLANKGSLLDASGFSQTLASLDYLHLDFLDVSSNITSLFNDAFGEQRERWALLFDELETAPEWIVEQLFSAFRVSDPKLYLKLAISPVSPTALKTIVSAVGPDVGNDHRQVRLWYTDKVNSKAFCQNLWLSLTRKHGVNITAHEALGPSAFDPGDKRTAERKSPYSSGAPWHKLFTSLASKDRSFNAFLKAQSIDLKNAGEIHQHKRDTVLRKAAPVAAVREYFLHQARDGSISSRARKTSELYAGADSIFAITEGNPRWFIGVVSPLVAYMVKNNVDKVPRDVQAKEIDCAADRLIALLKTIPVKSHSFGRGPESLDVILNKIGTSLHDEIMLRNFTLDPKLSFTVDKDVPADIQDLIASGLNRGAVMLIEDTAARTIVGEMRDAKLRLSYLLAAKYGLPLRKGKTKMLSSILFPKQATHIDQLQLKVDLE
jgi:energy-coupling factor transporter ATP-binding protein EcfA2